MSIEANNIKSDAAAAAKAMSNIMVVKKANGWEIPGQGFYITEEKDGYELTMTVIIPGGGSSFMGWYPESSETLVVGCYSSLRHAVQAAMIEIAKVAFEANEEKEWAAKMASEHQAEHEAAKKFLELA